MRYSRRQVPPTGARGKYLTFRLAQEEYGLEILKVREIIGLMDITKVPKTPHDIRGVINLRGKVIPVLDLRLKFGMDAIEDTEETCIIVVDIASEDGSILMGILVDAVSEVPGYPIAGNRRLTDIRGGRRHKIYPGDREGKKYGKDSSRYRPGPHRSRCGFDGESRNGERGCTGDGGSDRLIIGTIIKN